MPKTKNKDIVKNLREKIAKAKSIIVTDYSGLSSNNMNLLRDTMKNTDAEVSIAKNTLLKIALKEEKIDTKEIDQDLDGTNAIVFAYKDAVAPIKSLFEFIKKIELPKVKSAIFEGKYSNALEVEAISTLPSKEQLIARVLGGFKSPLSGLTVVLGGVQRKLVYSLADLAKKKS